MTPSCASTIHVFCSCHMNRKCRILFFMIVFAPFFLFVTVYYNWPVFHVFINQDIMSPCVLPQFDFYDSSIANFFWKPDPVKCEPWDALMLIDSDGMLQFNSSAVKASGYDDLKCVYKKVVRVGDFNVTFTEETVFKKPVYIPHDIIYVQCKQNDKLVYDNLHFHIDNKSILQQKNLGTENQDELSIYMFGLDSLSHLLAERKMPLTMNYLRDNLGAYILNGYTKVGDNSHPNLVALYTGTTGGSELPGVNIDTMPFVWKNFSAKGYVDMYCEDWPSIATFTNFTVPPAHHYFRPFFLAAEKIRTQSIRNVRRLLLFLEHHNFRLKDVSFLCFGNTPKHQLVIDYYKRFIESYGNKKKIAVSFLNEIGHDFLNFYEHGDRDTMKLFKWMKESKKLDNGVIVLYADHGPRYSEIQNTGIGRVTSMMPTLAIYIPKQIRDRFPHLHANLMKNTERLTTPFDVHETLMDILNKNFQVQKPVDIRKSIPRGISLFREIPESRSCNQAGIPEHYCPCYSSKLINIKDPVVREVSLYIVDKINHILEHDLHRCAKLTLNTTHRASLVKSNFVRDKAVEEWSLRTFVYTSSEDRRYLIALDTFPSKGKFEATVQYNGKSDMKLLGDISRINKYGNQSSCIPDIRDQLKLYCFCIK
ncbi:uncharacterized protein LOC134699353 [Mytilus trossulus]|uniref:uncharacterized protein LOC134699353 n=1 Tax=Mytilus trossulus TaxID=6551 RepID=UPI003003C3CF